MKESIDTQTDLVALEDMLGHETVKMVERDAIIMEVLRENQSLFAQIAPRIIIVGSTRVGKTTLIGHLLDKEFRLARDLLTVEGKPDTSNRIVGIEFPSKMVIYDTPGVGGFEDINEDVTYAFLGISRPRRRSRRVQERHRRPNRKTLPIQFYSALTGQSRRPRRIPISHPLVGTFDLIVFMLDIDAYRGDDLKFYQAILRKYRKSRPVTPVLLVVNKIDKYGSESAITRKNLEIIGAKFKAEPIEVSAEKGTNLETLVQKTFMHLPEAAVSIFNYAIDARYRLERNGRVREIVLRVAAQAAARDIRERSSATGSPLFETLMRGLMLRMTLEFSGVDESSDYKARLAEMIKSLYLGVESKRVEVTEEVREEVRVEKRQRWREEIHFEKVVEQVWQEVGDFAPAGGVAGAATGAAIGTALLPGFGTLIGGLLGLLLGVGSGASQKRVVRKPIEKQVPRVRRIREVVDVPITTRKAHKVEVSKCGGYDGARVMFAFGSAYISLLHDVEARALLSADPVAFQSRFSIALEALSEKLRSFEEKLNDVQNEQAAYEILARIPF